MVSSYLGNKGDCMVISCLGGMGDWSVVAWVAWQQVKGSNHRLCKGDCMVISCLGGRGDWSLVTWMHLHSVHKKVFLKIQNSLEHDHLNNLVETHPRYIATKFEDDSANSLGEI